MAYKFIYEDKVLNFSQSNIQDGSTSGTTTWSSAKIKNQLDTKQNTLSFDTTPTTNSNNPVTSAGIKQYTDSAVSAEATARDSAISSAISTEVTNRNSAISSAVSAEATARDSAISSAISTEVTNRNSEINSTKFEKVSTFTTTLTVASGGTFTFTTVDNVIYIMKLKNTYIYEGTIKYYSGYSNTAIFTKQDLENTGTFFHLQAYYSKTTSLPTSTDDFKKASFNFSLNQNSGIVTVNYAVENLDTTKENLSLIIEGYRLN